MHIRRLATVVLVQPQRLKASALLAALRGDSVSREADRVGAGSTQANARTQAVAKKPIRALMVDHRDSFVHNLASYFRECGVELITLRPDAARMRPPLEPPRE